MSSKEKIEEILKHADIEIGGNRPFDIQVHNERFYNRVFSGGSLALGESYMDGWWSTEDLSELINKVLRADLRSKVGKDLETWFFVLKSKLTNRQNRKHSREVIDEHYDLGNDLYASFLLDSHKQYTCGYFKDTNDLEVAQEQKLDLICRKLKFKKGDRVLDIGCGFGGFAKYAAENYGVDVVGITISKEQLKYAKENTKGLSVDIRFEDYRDIDEKFDHIVSIGMFEAVGSKNFREYMEKVQSLLKDDGLFLLHTIGSNKSVIEGDPWINKYIFPNGMLPSIKQVGESIEGLFVMEDWHNFGAYYDKTLQEWFKNFDSNWHTLKDKYNDRFYRMWKYYLLMCSGTFRARNTQLWQIVLSKDGVPGGYDRIS